MSHPAGRYVARHRGASCLGLVLAVAVGHALLVAPRYHVGSFDDDAGYILAARALAAGAGFTTKSIVGHPLVTVYPPGFPSLLAPLEWLWPGQVLPFRLLSLVCFAAVFPLTWIYLARRKLRPGLRLTTLLLLALSPLLATYATMVMPEMAFLVVLLLLLIAEERWERDHRALTGAGLATVTAVAALILLKEAGVGLAIGVVAWLVLRRQWRKAVMAAVGPALAYLPVVLARAWLGGPLIGSRYSNELGLPTGGVISRTAHLAPKALWAYLSDAIPRSIVPTYVSPLPLSGPISAVLAIIQWTAAPLVLVGFAVWVTRHRDVTTAAIPLYLLETLVYPFTNERRVVLVLPVVVAWYVLGAAQLTTTVMAVAQRPGASRGRRRMIPAVGLAGPAVVALVALVALVAQLPRDYLYSVGQDSSAPAGSPYMALLRALGPPSAAVETDYLWTTALLSGHRSANGAYRAPCRRGAIARAIAADRSGYLLSAALNRPDVLPSPCLLPLIADQPGAVRLYRTKADRASVFELVGPGTAHPGLSDLMSGARLTASPPAVAQVPEMAQIPGDAAGSYPVVPTASGIATLTWAWSGARLVSQVSLGAAGSPGPVGDGRRRSRAAVSIDMLGSDGSWHVVASSPGSVGPERSTRYLLAQFPQPVPVSAVRVTVASPDTAAVHDLHVLGPAS